MWTEDYLIKEVQSELSIVPNKISFKIGEIAKLLEVKTHVLRYWEEEFSFLKPKKFSNNQRLYLKKDIEILFLIRHLLYRKKFSIKGVQENLLHYYRQLKESNKRSEETKKHDDKTVKKIKELLLGIKAIKCKLEGRIF